MQPISNFPDVEEWLAQMHADPARAKSHLKHLLRQQSIYGVNAPPQLVLSINDYAQAEERLAQATTPDIAPPPRDPSVADSYPDEQRWRDLLATEPQRASKHYNALQVQAARYGLGIPFALQNSLDAYRKVQAERPAAPPPRPRPWWKRLLGLQ